MRTSNISFSSLLLRLVLCGCFFFGNSQWLSAQVVNSSQGNSGGCPCCPSCQCGLECKCGPASQCGPDCKCVGGQATPFLSSQHSLTSSTATPYVVSYDHPTNGAYLNDNGFRGEYQSAPCEQGRFAKFVAYLTRDWYPTQCNDRAWLYATANLRIINDYEEDTCCYSNGIFMPEDPPLFKQFAANPRQVTYSVGWRFNDRALTKNVIPVSFGDSMPLYRWLNICGGEMQLDIEGCLWGTFDPVSESSPLLNADYYFGFPLTWAKNRLSLRLRPYHISCHLGDEFLLNHPGFDRRNPSAEYIDFYASYYLTDELRVYGGIGYVLHQDSSFKNKRFFGAIGTELRVAQLGFLRECDGFYGQPYFAAHYRFNGNYTHHLDQTYCLGYEFGKLSGLCRLARLFMEYHDGYSSEGQFSWTPTTYFALRLTYGF